MQQTSTHSGNDGGRAPSQAFLGSLTQAYVQAPARRAAHVELVSGASPAFLGSPTQHYEG